MKGLLTLIVSRIRAQLHDTTFSNGTCHVCASAAFKARHVACLCGDEAQTQTHARTTTARDFFFPRGVGRALDFFLTSVRV